MPTCLLSLVCCPFKVNEWKIPSMTSHLSEPTFTDPKSAWLGSFTNRGRRGQAWEHMLMLESGGGCFFNDLSMDSTVKSRPAVGSAKKWTDHVTGKRVHDICPPYTSEEVTCHLSHTHRTSSFLWRSSLTHYFDSRRGNDDLWGCTWSFDLHKLCLKAEEGKWKSECQWYASSYANVAIGIKK